MIPPALDNGTRPGFEGIPGNVEYYSKTEKILMAISIICMISGIIAFVLGNTGVVPLFNQSILTIGGFGLTGISPCILGVILIKNSHCKRKMQNISGHETRETANLNINRESTLDPENNQNSNLNTNRESILDPENNQNFSSLSDEPPSSRNPTLLQGFDFNDFEDEEFMGESLKTPQEIIDKQSYEYAYSEIDDQDRFLVVVRREHIKENPEYHLDKFCELILQNKNGPLEVDFLNNRGERENGIDMGGLRRTYINNLFSNVLQYQLCCGTSNSSGLFYPKARQDKDLNTFVKLGKIMGYCKNQAYKIGAQFDASTYSAILNGFNSDELNRTYQLLSRECKIKVIDGFLNARESNTSHQNIEEEEERVLWDVIKSSEDVKENDCKLMLKYIIKKSINICEDSNSELIGRRNAFLTQFYSFYKAENHLEENIDLYDLEVHMQEKVQQNTPLLNNEHYQQLFNDFPDVMKDLKNDLFTAAFEPYVKALHSLAKGFRLSIGSSQAAIDRNWRLIRSTYIDDNNPELCKYQDFQTEIQGTIDRETIASSIIYGDNNPVVRQKADWLKEWIRNEATPKEIRNFLIYSTGLSSLSEKIKVRAQSQVDDPLTRDIHGYTPLPIAHTCFYTIEFAPQPSSFSTGEMNRQHDENTERSEAESLSIARFNDHNKENFINCLKIAISEGGGGFHIA